MVQIIGAGFSGLTLAYFLVKKGVAVRIFEKSTRAGGLISSRRVDGTLIETAANGMLSNALVEEMAQAIGIELYETKKESRKRYILRRTVLWRWPLSIAESFQFAWHFLPRLFFRRLRPQKNESLLQWGRRNLGSAATQYLLAPALQGIYAGDIEKMCAQLILGRFFKKQKAPRGQMRGTVAPQDGMGSFIQNLEKWLRKNGVDFQYDRNIEKLPSGSVVIACGPHAAASLLADSHPDLAKSLSEVEILPLATVTLAVSKGQEVVQGFGCLFPQNEQMNALGVLVNTCIFSERSGSDVGTETWILGGARDLITPFESEEQILQKIFADRKRLGRTEKPQRSFIQKWPMALPHFTEKLAKAQELYAGSSMNQDSVWLTGNYLGAIGLSQIIWQNSNLAEEIFKKVRGV